MEKLLLKRLCCDYVTEFLKANSVEMFSVKQKVIKNTQKLRENGRSEGDL